MFSIFIKKRFNSLQPVNTHFSNVLNILTLHSIWEWSEIHLNYNCNPFRKLKTNVSIKLQVLKCIYLQLFSLINTTLHLSQDWRDFPCVLTQLNYYVKFCITIQHHHKNMWLFHEWIAPHSLSYKQQCNEHIGRSSSSPNFKSLSRKKKNQLNQKLNFLIQLIFFFFFKFHFLVFWDAFLCVALVVLALIGIHPALSPECWDEVSPLPGRAVFTSGSLPVLRTPLNYHFS